MVSDRAAPRLGSTTKPTVPFPLPVPPEATLIHEALVAAVHAHPAGAVTPTEPGPPRAVSEALLAPSVYVHVGVGAAAWLTVNVWLAIVIVPLRAAPVFAATVKPTDPLPVPLAPAVTVIHDALLTAFHVQLAVDGVTVIAVPAPPVAAIDSLFGATA